jgi:hypothetical protein
MGRVVGLDHVRGSHRTLRTQRGARRLEGVWALRNGQASDAADLFERVRVGSCDRNRRVQRRNRQLHSRPNVDGDASLRRVREGQANPHENLHGRMRVGRVRGVERLCRSFGRVHPRRRSRDSHGELHDLRNEDGVSKLQREHVHVECLGRDERVRLVRGVLDRHVLRHAARCREPWNLVPSTSLQSGASAGRLQRRRGKRVRNEDRAVLHGVSMIG